MEKLDINRIMEMRMAESLRIATPSEGGESAQTSEQTNRQPKRRRGLPGTPDPEAEVVALSPKSLLETNKYVCDICGKGFQREQNLQLHRRGHNLPWKLKQREPEQEVKKKVYVCPEPTCVHHDPARALGDLTGIKKHYCRKHGEKKFTCEKCNKSYAVQGDWRAHMRLCGTRVFRCQCGTVFSRRDGYITHRLLCDAALLAQETVRSQPLTVAVHTTTPSTPLQPPTPSTAVLSPPVLPGVHENRSGHSHQINTGPLISANEAFGGLFTLSMHSEKQKEAATIQERTKAPALSLNLDIGNNNNDRDDEDFAGMCQLSLHTAGNKEKEPPLSLSLATPPVYPSTNNNNPASLFLPTSSNPQPVLSSSSSAAHDHRRDNDICSELSLSLQPSPPMMFSTNLPTLDLLGLGRGANQFGMASSSSSSGGVLGDNRDDNADKKPWFV